MSEAELLSAVRQLAKLTGWMAYHTADSRRSDAGWPDLVLASVRQQRVIFVELKAADGRLSVAQKAWLAALAAAGCETYVWRPSDLQRTIPAVLSARAGGDDLAHVDSPRLNERTTEHDHRWPL